METETRDDDDHEAQQPPQPQPVHEIQLDVAIHNVEMLSKLCAEVTQSDEIHVSKEAIQAAKLGLFDMITRAKQANDWFESLK